MNFLLILKSNGLKKIVKKCKHLTTKTRKKCKPKMNHPNIFLLNKEYDTIRQQLLNPDKEIYPWKPFIKDQFTSDKIGTYYVHNKGAESIFNIFSLKTEYSETLIGGLLPVPTIPIAEFVKSMNGQKNHQMVLTLDTTSYDPNADLFNDIAEIRKITRWLDKTKNCR
jgi:hypothetical protein